VCAYQCPPPDRFQCYHLDNIKSFKSMETEERSKQQPVDGLYDDAISGSSFNLIGRSLTVSSFTSRDNCLSVGRKPSRPLEQLAGST